MLLFQVMSIDRYIAVCHTLSFVHRLRNQNSAFIVTLCVWMAALLLCIPVMLYSVKTGTHPKCICSWVETNRIYKTICNMLEHTDGNVWFKNEMKISLFYVYSDMNFRILRTWLTLVSRKVTTRRKKLRDAKKVYRGWIKPVEKRFACKCLISRPKQFIAVVLFKNKQELNKTKPKKPRFKVYLKRIFCFL